MEETEVVNIKKEECDEYIGRGKEGNAHMNNTKVGKRGWLGNPYRVGNYTRDESIQKFKEDFYERLKNDKVFREEVNKLMGKKLGCFCKPKDCHGDVIKEYLELLQEYCEFYELIGRLP